jgi:hypothetical protein
MMKNLSITMITLLMLGLSVGSARANAYTLKAENGRILAPAGLGVNLNSELVTGSALTARASYGIARTVTLEAAWRQKDLALKAPSWDELQLKAYFSPTRGNSGYTAYLGYNPSRQEFIDYGVTFWNNFRWLYSFINLDFSQTSASNQQLIRVTPGVSLQLTSRARLSAELETDPFDWKAEELRVGAGYKLYNRLTAKAVASQNLTAAKNRTYSLGLALEM